MEKKLVSILTIVLLVLAIILCSCGPTGNNNGDDDGDSTIANLDVLTLALGRLENADLDFTFNVGNAFANSAQSASVASEASPAAITPWHFTPDDMVTDQIDYDPFKDDQSMMDTMSEDARKIVDDLVDNITVMDTPIYKDGTFYYLTYDATNDAVCATIYQDPIAEQNAPSDPNASDSVDNNTMGGNFGTVGGGDASAPSNPTGNTIKIYYDENGNETVEYINHFEINGMRCMHYMLYTKNVRYTIINYSEEQQKHNINYTNAAKVNGKWCAIKMHIDTSNYVLDENKAIAEDYSGISMDIFQEMDETSIYYHQTMRRDQDGLYFYDFGLEAPGLAFFPNNGQYDTADIQINLCLLEGWSDYHLNMAGWEVDMNGGQYEFGNGLNPEENEVPWDTEDYIIFDNGIRLNGADVSNGRYLIDGIDAPIMWYTEGEGKEYWYTTDWDSSFPTMTSGTLFEKKYGDLGGKIQGIFSMIYPGAEVEHVRSDITFNVLGNTVYQQFVSLSMLFEKYGLSWDSDRFSANFTNSLYDTITNQSDYQNRVFNILLGFDYQPANVKNFVFDLDAQMSTLASGFVTTIEGYRNVTAMHYNALPARPDNLGLINITDNLSGKATVSENGMDFSQISINVSKCILLSQGKEYTALTYLASGDNMVIIDAFDVVNYDNANFTLIGKAAVNLPHVEQDGEYTLYTCIAKKVDNEYVRLSELIKLEVNSFATFTVNNDGVGGEYNDTYSYKNGHLKVVAAFDDVQAPSVEVVDIQDVDNDGIYDLMAGMRTEEVLAKIVVEDNRDGVIVISTLHIIEDESNMPIHANYNFESGKSYSLVVKDKAGNETTVKFSVI